MKVVYVGGRCEFCDGFVKNYPHSYDTDDTNLTQGRCYTVVFQFHVETPWGKGCGYRLAEYELPPDWGHCSCGFREIDGDADAWKKVMEANRPKVKELEPA